MYKESFFLVIVCILIFAGCSSTNPLDEQSYCPPKLDAHKADHAKANNTGKVIDLSAKVDSKQEQMVFNKKESWTLKECIDYSLKNNDKLKMLEAKKKVKEGEINEEWSDYLPSSRYKYNHGKSNETGESDVYNISGKALIWATGKIKSKVKALKAEIAMYEEEKKDEELKTIYEVKKYFYELLFRTQHINSKELALAEEKEYKREIEEKFKNGRARKVDVIGTKASVSDADRELFESKNNYVQTKENLNNAMGRDLAAPIRPNGKLTFTQIPLYKDKLTKRAIRNNHLLKKILKGMDQAKYSKEAAYRKLFPDFYLNAFWEYRDTTKAYNGDRIFQGPAYGIGVEIDLPLFRQIGKSFALQKQAKFTLKRLDHEYNKAKRDVAYNITKICNKMEECSKGIQSAQVNIEYRSQMLNNIQIGMKEKLYSDKDLAEAKKNLSEARTYLLKYILEYNVAKAQLDRALGIREK